MRLLITRPEPDASALKPELEALGVEVFVEPMLSVAFEDADLPALEGVQALIATSRNGLRGLTKAVSQASSADLMTRARQLPLFAVGPATAQLARDLGFDKLYCGPGEAVGLPALIAKMLKPDNGQLLQLAGAHLAFDLAPQLRSLGFEFTCLRLYRTIARDKLSTELTTLFRQGKIDSVMLMSPRTATIYVELVTSEQLIDATNEITHFCLSERVSKRLAKLNNRLIKIAKTPNQEEMLALIADSVAKRH